MAVAFAVGRNGPKWEGTSENYGYYLGLGLIGLFGVFCIAGLPFLLRWMLTGKETRLASGETISVPAALAGPVLLLMMLLFGALPWVLFPRQLADGIGGPKEVSTTDLANCTDPNTLPSRWIKLKPDQRIDTKVSYQVKKRGIVTTYLVELLKVKDKYLIVTSDKNMLFHAEGYLTEPGKGGGGFDSSKPSLAELQKKYPNEMKSSLPFELDVLDARTIQMNCFLPVIIIWPMALLIGLVGVQRIWARYQAMHRLASQRPGLVLPSPGDGWARRG